MRPISGAAARGLAVALVLLWTAGSGACARRGRFVNTFTSETAAAEAVVRALAARDAAALEALAVSEQEFRDAVWPALPASRPEFGMPVDYVWADTSARSRGHLGQVLHDYGGRPLTIEDVHFLGRTTDYGAFRIHAKTSVRVREADGTVRDLRLFGSMLEAGGRWKVFSYIVD